MTPFRLRTRASEFALGLGETRIGRAASCEIAIDDPCLSREHAVLRVERSRVTLRDLGSRNGTFVNDLPVTEEIELHAGDRIDIGSTSATLLRALETRRNFETTASFRTCAGCGGAYVVQAPACPRCGRVSVLGAASGPSRSDSQRRFDFWLQLEAELLDKAMSMQRVEEAESSWRRLVDKLDALGDREFVHPVHLDAALCAAVRLGRMQSNEAPIAWAIGVIHRQGRPPSAELFALLAATPLPLLAREQSFGALERFVADLQARSDLGPGEASCRTSLAELLAELSATRRPRASLRAREAVTHAE